MSRPAFPPSIEISCGPVTAVDLALYAAASGDLNPLHLDDSVARKAGFDQPLVHGMLTMAYVARLFTQTFGSSALLALNTRFIGVAKRGDTLVLSASLSECDDRSALYSVRGTTTAGSEIVSGSAHVRLGGLPQPNIAAP
jgi:acyl dehydratase